MLSFCWMDCVNSIPATPMRIVKRRSSSGTGAAVVPTARRTGRRQCPRPRHRRVHRGRSYFLIIAPGTPWLATVCWTRGWHREGAGRQVPPCTALRASGASLDSPCIEWTNPPCRPVTRRLAGQRLFDRRLLDRHRRGVAIRSEARRSNRDLPALLQATPLRVDYQLGRSGVPSVQPLTSWPFRRRRR